MKKSPKNNRKIMRAIIFLIIVSLGFLVAKKLFIFKEYYYSDLNLKIKYPPTWTVSTEGRSLTIKNTPKIVYSDPLTESEIEDYSEFNISCSPLEGDDLYLSAEEYLSKDLEEYREWEQQQCQKGGPPCLPIVPGYSQHFIGDASYIFPETVNSAAEVNFFHYAPDSEHELLKEYVLITKSNLECTVHLILPPIFSTYFPGYLKVFNRMINSLTFQ